MKKIKDSLSVIQHLLDKLRSYLKSSNGFIKQYLSFQFFFLLIIGNQKDKSIIETEVTVRSPFITYSSQNPWNFLDMEVIIIKICEFNISMRQKVEKKKSFYSVPLPISVPLMDQVSTCKFP